MLWRNEIRKAGFYIENMRRPVKIRRLMQNELPADWKLSVRQRSASLPSWDTASISILSEFTTEYIVFLSKYTVNTLVVRKFDDP